jgi:EAL domain-containing protein (putative c-di-GMP-specific phosphodiesterase class I)
MAHGLKLKVVAEGVETEAQLAFLRSHYCDEYQGFLTSRALEANAFMALVKSRQPKELVLAAD